MSESPYIDIHFHARGTLPLRDETIVRLSNYRIGSEVIPPNGLFAAGIHPWDVVAVATSLAFPDFPGATAPLFRSQNLSETIHYNLLQKNLKKMFPIENERFVMVGEVGFDFSQGRETESIQRVFFEAQLALALAWKLPILIHCVRAQTETLQLLKSFREGLKNRLIHGFVGSEQQAVAWVKAGCYVSVGERGLASPKTLNAVHKIPLDRLFFETDTGELPITEIYRRYAVELSLDLLELKQKIVANYNLFFR